MDKICVSLTGAKLTTAQGQPGSHFVGKICIVTGPRKIDRTPRQGFTQTFVQFARCITQCHHTLCVDGPTDGFTASYARQTECQGELLRLVSWVVTICPRRVSSRAAKGMVPVLHSRMYTLRGKCCIYCGGGVVCTCFREECVGSQDEVGGHRGGWGRFKGGQYAFDAGGVLPEVITIEWDTQHTT